MNDKLIVIENIKQMAKYRKINLSDLEKSVGVSIGYFARLAYDIKESRNTSKYRVAKEERSLPSVEVFEKLSTILNFSIDKLLNFDLSKLEEPELALLSLLDYLNLNTKNDSFIWTKEQILDHYDHVPYEGLNEHPLFLIDDCEPSYYFSLFLENVADVFKIYRLRINGVVFLLCHISSSEIGYIELYSISDSSCSPIINCNLTFESSSPIENELKALFKSVEKNVKNNPGGKNLAKLVNGLMDKIQSNK